MRIRPWPPFEPSCGHWEGKSGSSTGGPSRDIAPFTWREEGDSRRLDVAPAALETTRLATVENCVRAMRADLIALRESLDGSEVSVDLWDGVVAALGPLLDRPSETTG